MTSIADPPSLARTSAERVRALVARAIGRTLPVRGVDRVLRLLYHPDKREASYTTSVSRLRDGSLFEVDTRNYLEWRLFVYGDYEPDVRRAIRRCLRAGDTAIDVGANIGIHTITMARAVGSKGKVVAIEPFAEATTRLRRNLEHNGLSNICSVVPKAASSHCGHTFFYTPGPTASNQAQGSLLPLAYLQPEPVDVELTTLDALAHEYRLDRVRLVKIDVEGWESEVMEGARELIGDQRPYVLFEYSPSQFGDGLSKWNELRYLVEKPLSYCFFEVAPHSLRPLRLRGGRPSRACMVLADPGSAREPMRGGPGSA